MCSILHLVLFFLFSRSVSAQIVHYTLNRRGGPFISSAIANLTVFSEQLSQAETRFSHTKRSLERNRVSRIPKVQGSEGGDAKQLLGTIGLNGTWYATLKIGSPEQSIQVDVDLLSSDFLLYSTTSSLGSKFEALFSQSYQRSGNQVFSSCTVSSDSHHLPSNREKVSIHFAHCQPSKYSLQTLQASGGILGLAPSDSLSQTSSPHLVNQLHESQFVGEKVWSLIFINSHEAVLSMGGTAARAVHEAEIKIKALLAAATGPSVAKRHDLEEGLRKSSPSTGRKIQKRELQNLQLNEMDASWRQQWRWTSTEGAEGWWQFLAQGMHVNGARIMKNQPMILDISTPFILAPPSAIERFYAAIPGSYRLATPHSSFFAVPCLNPPTMALEVGGWNFPFLRGTQYHPGKGPIPHRGGRLSLGKLEKGSGYCVGAVVETRIGVDDRERAGEDEYSHGGEMSGNGLKNAWILGEVALKAFGLGVVFDVEGKRIGFRSD